MQVVPVYDHHDGGGANLRGVSAAQGKLTCQKRHGIGFAAAGCAKISAALADAADYRLHDALFQLPCGEELRITADDLHFAAVVDTILKIDVIPENFQKPCRTVHAVDEGFRLSKRQGGKLVAVVHTPPCVEMLIRGTHRTQPGLDSIRDAGKGAVVQ